MICGKRVASWAIVSVALLWTPAARAGENTWTSPPPVAGGPIVFQTATAKDEDPAAAGKAAALALKRAMGDAPLRAVIVSECFEDKENKQKAISGICLALPKQIVVGAATYGAFTQAGCTDADAVCLLGIGGQGIGVSAVLVTEMGAAKLSPDKDRPLIEQRLHAAGAKLAGTLSRPLPLVLPNPPIHAAGAKSYQALSPSPANRLLVLIADAHSPKNQFLVEGVQRVVGKQFPIVGGCANKNAGQTFVYFDGRMHEDSAVALMLCGDFQVSLSGRQAKDNDHVISTAREGAAAALAKAKGRPIAVLAFDCAGRRGKLKNIADELAAMQQPLGRELPLFGCYCAGEMGPVDQSGWSADVLCGGSGWHVMFVVLSR